MHDEAFARGSRTSTVGGRGFSGHLFRPVERGKKPKPKNKRFGMQAARLIRACVVVCALFAAVGIATEAPAQGKLDLGLTTAAVRTPDMPLYTFRNNMTGEVIETTDPGRALITGKWEHISLLKGPVRRGLASRAPYFHNGMAATLADVVDFYDSRFNIGLSAKEKSDLVAFLKAL